MLFLVAFVLHSIRYLGCSWPYTRFIRSNGMLLQVLEERGSPWMISFSIGMASRAAVGGPVTSLITPPDLHELRRVAVAEGALDPYNATLLQQMCGMGLEVLRYDPVLQQDALRLLLENRQVLEYPDDVYAVSSEAQDGTVVLFTDDAHESVYCVPGPIAPRGTQP